MRKKASGQSKKRSASKPATLPSIKFKKTELSNGIRVLTEKHGLSRAVSCGVWVNRGTRDELAGEEGLAHFIEHMVFKRTENRSAYEISRDMEAVGGDLNAFTSREYTSYITHSLKEHLGLSLDVLSDLVCRPSFDNGDIRKEKQVVTQEIHMAEEQLEDNIFDKYFELTYPDSPIGKPILGTVDSISGMKRPTLQDFYRRQYTSANIIVSVAGNVDHDEAVEFVNRHLVLPSKNKSLSKESQTQGESRKPQMRGFRDVVHKPSEQAHILIGLPAADFRSHLRFEGYIVNTLLGGGMTSRLYQTVREDRGLVYSIYSQLVTFVDAGMMLTYAGTEPKRAPEVVQLILKETRKLKKQGVKKTDLDFFKTQVKGQILLGADDIEARMSSLSVNEMVFGRYRSVDDVIEDIDKISVDSVREYLDEYLDESRLGVLIMGAMPEGPAIKWLDGL